MSLKVGIAKMDAEKLFEFVKRFRAEVPFAILESLDKVDFPGPSEDIEPTQWSKGRIFGQGLELYWEQKGSMYYVRLSRDDENPLPPEFDEVEGLSDLNSEPIWYYLWGEDDVAIGGRLDYSRAIPGKGRARLGVIEYRDERGRLVFYRYFGLKREG